MHATIKTPAAERASDGPNPTRRSPTGLSLTTDCVPKTANCITCVSSRIDTRSLSVSFALNGCLRPPPKIPGVGTGHRRHAAAIVLRRGGLGPFGGQVRAQPPKVIGSGARQPCASSSRRPNRHHDARVWHGSMPALTRFRGCRKGLIALDKRNRHLG